MKKLKKDTVTFVDNLLYMRHRWLEMHPKKKKRGKYSKFWVSVIIVLNVLFSIMVFKVFEETGAEPVTLVQEFFKFTRIELGILAGLKTVKIVKNIRDKEEEAE